MTLWERIKRSVKIYGLNLSTQVVDSMSLMNPFLIVWANQNFWGIAYLVGFGKKTNANEDKPLQNFIFDIKIDSKQK